MSESNNENNNTSENNESNNKNPLDQAPIESTGDIFKNKNNIDKEEKEEKEENKEKEKEETEEKEEAKQIEIKEVKEEKEDKKVKEEKGQKENEQEINKENQNKKKEDYNININNNNITNNNTNQNPIEDNNVNLPLYQNFQENINNKIYKNIPKENNIPQKKEQYNPPNNLNNNPNNNNNFNENNKRYDHDNKKISQIIERCELLYKQSRVLYENYEIQKAIINLTNAVKGLDGLKQSIVNNKTEFNNFLPQVTSMRTKYFNYLHKYHLTIYQLIPRKFSPIRFNQGENIQEFVKKYILTEPFVTFDDIYEQSADKNKSIKSMIYDNYQKSLRLKYKNLLLYGPKGSGKTLAVHALANQLKGKVAQLEGIELFKIPNFSLEFVKAAFNFMQNKPLIIYIRNIEKMLSNMNNFNFIYDKVCASKLNDVILIASCSYQPPKPVSEKFHYAICVRPCEKNQKINLMKFIAKKLGINYNITEKDLALFVYQNLENFSNEDIFNLIVGAIDIKKNKLGNGEEMLEQVYKDGINLEDLHNALNNVKGSLTQEDIKNYYL